MEKIKPEEHNNLKDFVVEKGFLVDGVISETKREKINSDNPVIGSRTPQKDAGHSVELSLDVQPKEPDVPIETIRFIGHSNVRGGDDISAKIPKYHKEKTSGGPLYGDREVAYEERRGFNTEEYAVELAILDDDGVARRDRAENYGLFFKE